MDQIYISSMKTPFGNWQMLNWDGCSETPGNSAHRLTSSQSLSLLLSVADVKMEIPDLVRSLKSSTLSSTSFQMDKTLWGVGSAAVEQSRRKAHMVAQGDGKFGP